MTLQRRAVLALSLFLCALGALGASQAAAQPSPAPEVLRIWPGRPPGTSDWKGPETAKDGPSPDLGRKIRIVSNVTDPTLTVFRPTPSRATGAAMIVLPGGAFGVLAVDVEGTEVAQWLAERGVTAFLLKYRVAGASPEMAPRIKALFANPGPDLFDQFAVILEPRRRIAVDDALQAVRTVRSNAARFGLSPDRIGMIGFSAGAMTTMGAVLEGDTASRPNFAAPIYGAMRNQAPPKDGPSLFLVHTQDDDAVPVGKSVDIFQAWQKARLPAELHVYPIGGHGYGLGKPGTASAAWPQAFEAWLRTQKAVVGAPAGRGKEGPQP